MDRAITGEEYDKVWLNATEYVVVKEWGHNFTVDLVGDCGARSVSLSQDQMEHLHAAIGGALARRKARPAPEQPQGESAMPEKKVEPGSARVEARELVRRILRDVLRSLGSDDD